MTDILVIDDDQDVCDCLKAVLQEYGTYKVDVAVTSEDAQKKALLEPDIVLLDLHLDAGQSGKDLLNGNTFSNAAIIVITAQELSDDNRADMMEQGVFDVITKPFNNRVLVEKIKRALMIRSVNQPSRSTIINLREAQQSFYAAQNLLQSFM